MGHYLNGPNDDLFNAEIKLLSNGRYIESSNFTTKKDKIALDNMHRIKQAEVAAVAFKQDSLPKGLVSKLILLPVELFFLAIVVLKENLPYEYLTLGDRMRSNVEYELQSANKRKQLDYKPFYDSTTFK